MAIRFEIEYSPDTVEHIRALRPGQRSVLFGAVDRHLQNEPDRETRNRKPMRPNPLAPWELRVGSLRVYYDIEMEPEPRVLIRAVGVKVGNRVLIGREAMRL